MIKTITYHIDENKLPSETLEVLRSEAIRKRCSFDSLVTSALKDLARRINGDAAHVQSTGKASRGLGDSTHRSAQAPTLGQGQGTKGNEKAMKG